MNSPTEISSGPRAARPRALRRYLSAVAVTLAVLAFGATSAAAAVPSTFFGISVVRPNASDFKGMADKLGAGSVRIEISWPNVQRHRNGDFIWEGVDRKFRQAATFGLRPQPIIFGTPTFISRQPGMITPPVKSKKARAEWQDFARAATERYGPGGHFWVHNPGVDARLAPRNWIIWNEQNARAFWHPKANPKQYGQLLRITRAAFDDVDPALLITVGGMFGYPENKKASIPMKPYLKRLYRQRGVARLIDAVSLHPYGGNIGVVKRQVRDARRVMDRAGDRKAKLIIGEVGWASGGTPKSYFLIKNKSIQKRRLRQSYNLFLHKRKDWKIVGAYWFTYRDYSGVEVCNWCPQAGLLNEKGKFKPAGSAYRRLVASSTR